jgi:hypothetical protein
MNTGTLVNMMAADTAKLEILMSFFHFGWTSVFQLAAVIYLLWRNLGPSCLAGVGALLLLVPIQGSFFVSLSLLVALSLLSFVL